MKFELHPHEISLNYALPHNEVEASPHSCNICNKVLDYKIWTYNCADCNFNVHICCATGKTRKAVCQETEENFDGDHQPAAAMGHHGFHNQPSSGRPFISPQSAFLAQRLAQANESINLLGTVGLQHTKFQFF
ncbi:hypothetical protein LWI29_019770 [Acer saccharum]|uniref:Phorbol-ester/DAG-type domain-containing protein n=1 Tax=Acer saccharum TaxID=4024 RepID=A0AA39TTD6_ACESA|nr:hypothetical protein LWI29_019770 [Acer saccharum]KAK1591350.1 hypothetical protein Q3G72_006275 [Acer saccharum]